MEYWKNLDLKDIVYFCEIDNIEKTEQWKDIVGYENLYKVSDLGRIKALKRMVPARNNSFSCKIERILKQATYKDYLRCCLTHESKKETVSIHRVVAIAFIPNPDNLPEINHKGLRPDGKEGNKSDNRVVSLEWSTRLQNAQHAKNNNLVTYVGGERHGASKLKEFQVLEIRALKGIKTQMELAKQYNISRYIIQSIQARKIWKKI
jgi:hypothetical protein